MQISSYNVHMWLTANNRPNLPMVAQVMKEHSADVTGLQEVYTVYDENAMEHLAQFLHSNFEFSEAGDTGLGNSLVTQHQILAQETHNLGGYRTISMVKIQGPNDPHPLTVFCLHLDHRQESRRQQQLQAALDFIRSQAPAPHVVVGDFNALRLSDYDDESLEKIAQVRKKNNWEEPRNEVVEMMDKAGYVDAYRFQLLMDCAESSSPESRSFSKAAYQRSLNDSRFKRNRLQFNTCWAESRIDFVWLSEDLMGMIDFKGYRRVESTASDHFPIFVDFEWKKSAK